MVTADERIFAGKQAQQHPERYKSKNITISSIKRLMGRKGETGWGWWKAYPQEVSAFILADLKSRAESYLDEEVKLAVIAIPSHFDEAQRRATKEAAEIAGLQVIRLLNEATAAVLAYGLYRPGGETSLVFDFGGGTLDISIVERGEGTYQVKCIEGDSRLGGDDFDQLIIDYILDEVHQKHGSAIEWDAAQKAILKETAEKAKVELSGTLATTIYIPGFLHVAQGFQDLNVPLERSTFEHLSKDLINRAIVLLNRALNGAGIKASALESVLLIGGTSRIPFVREAIRKELGREPITGVDVETCVAQGAVIQSALLQGNLGEILLLDCIPSSYGIALKADVFSPLIPKNATFPTSGSRTFTTTAANQSAIQVAIYQGESQKASDNAFLGTIELRDIPPAAAGVPQIEVTFDVDSDMIVRVKARDKGTSKGHAIQVTSPYGLNDTQIKVMHQRLKSWLSQRQVIDVKSEIELLVSAMEEILARSAIALGSDEVLALRECCTSLAKTRTRKCSYEELANMVQAMQPIVDKAQQKTVQYTKTLRDIDHLAAETGRLAPLMATERPFVLLTQGVNLLKDYVQLHSSFDELEKTLLPVRNLYEEIKTTLIMGEIRHLRTSREMAQWVCEVEKGLSDSSSVRQNLSKLRSINPVLMIVGILESEDAGYQASIQRKVSELIRGDSYLEACFSLIISSFVDHRHISDIDKVPIDESNSAILAFCIFNSLGSDRPDDIRRIAARNAANYLPDSKYIGPIVGRVLDERDAIARKYLLECVGRQPSGVLEELFVNAGTEIRAKMSTDKDMLVKLAREPNDGVRVFALQALLNLPPSSDSQVSALFSQALLDPVSKARVLAVEFVERERTPSCLSSILALLRAEGDETVIERAVTALCNIRGPESIPHLLRLLIEKGSNVRGILLPALEKDREFMSNDIRRIFDLTKRIALEERSIGFRDSIFLSRFSRTHPEMKDLASKLKEHRAGRGN